MIERTEEQKAIIRYFAAKKAAILQVATCNPLGVAQKIREYKFCCLVALSDTIDGDVSLYKKQILEEISRENRSI